MQMWTLWTLSCSKQQYAAGNNTIRWLPVNERGLMSIASGVDVRRAAVASGVLQLVRRSA
jgi:hypothetical protein